MMLKKYPELFNFLSTVVANGEVDEDLKTVKSFLIQAPEEKISLVVAQMKALLLESNLPLEEFGSEANRWFSDDSEAEAWLNEILNGLEAPAEARHSNRVKDSNGTELLEGDSVQVIKDLKVKGGSSDLKRGTLIKKIHLMGDPENIECRVDGSTLVLKTMFLKKS